MLRSKVADKPLSEENHKALKALLTLALRDGNEGDYDEDGNLRSLTFMARVVQAMSGGALPPTEPAVAVQVSPGVLLSASPQTGDKVAESLAQILESHGGMSEVLAGGL